MKSGLGSVTVSLRGVYEGVLVAALAAVNAFGDVKDPETGVLVAGARRSAESLELADTAREMKCGAGGGFQGGNTTLVVVATNATLTKVQATKLAQLAQNGVARAISPSHTMMDGDLVIALSLGAREADVDALGVAANEATVRAIMRAVRLAPSLGGLPGLGG
jgi:L-aminopeptidase/D-esterase-like protein